MSLPPSLGEDRGNHRVADVETGQGVPLSVRARHQASFYGVSMELPPVLTPRAGLPAYQHGDDTARNQPSMAATSQSAGSLSMSSPREGLPVYLSSSTISPFNTSQREVEDFMFHQSGRNLLGHSRAQAAYQQLLDPEICWPAPNSAQRESATHQSQGPRSGHFERERETWLVPS
jgi:hypothetical protein